MTEKHIEVCNCTHQGDHSKGLDYFQKGYYAINGKIDWRHIKNVLNQYREWAIAVLSVALVLAILWFIGSVLFSL